jgi:hypothetical protein
MSSYSNWPKTIGSERRLRGRKRGRCLFRATQADVDIGQDTTGLPRRCVTIRVLQYELTPYGHERINDPQLRVIIEIFGESLGRPIKAVFYSCARVDSPLRDPFRPNRILEFRVLIVVGTRLGNIVYLKRPKARRRRRAA